MWVFEICVFGDPELAEKSLQKAQRLIQSCQGHAGTEVFRPLDDPGALADHHSVNAPCLILCIGFEGRNTHIAAMKDGTVSKIADTFDPQLRLTGAAFERVRQEVPGDDLPGETYISNVVRYRGPCATPDEFVTEYMEPHLRLQEEFKGIRRILGFIPVDHDAILSERLEPAHYLVGNEVTFESAAEMRAALESTVRDRLRALRNDLPPFEGDVTHHIMKRSVLGRSIG